MSLATRCPSCGTVFRVVRDQLKVSDGWVRCGRCADVFNAAQRLFELEPDGLASAPPEPPATAAAPPLTAEPGPSASVPASPTISALHAAPAHEPLPEAEPVPLPEPAPTEAGEPARDVPSADEWAAPLPTPEFVRRADRAAWQRGPLPQVPLASLALLLVTLLAAQIGLHYRDRIAAEWPALRPLLQAACRPLGCEVQAPRRIDSLHVESSGLTRVQDSAMYRLSLVVRNRAPTEVRMPTVELTLNDAQGLTTARRVLSAAELGQPAARVGAGAELALQATLDLGELRVAGYTVELFYP